MQYTEREHARYSGTDTQGSQEFIPNFLFWQLGFDQISNECMYMHNLKTIHCPLLSDP